MITARRFGLVAGYILSLLLVPDVLCGQVPPKGDSSGTSAPTNQPDPVQRLRRALVQSALAPIDSPLGDYVQCRFTLAELLELRLSPDVVTLTAADSEELRKRVMTTAVSPEYEDALTDISTGEFIKNMATTDFTGKTQSQAVATILKVFDNAYRDTSEATRIAFSHMLSPSVSEDFLKAVNSISFDQGLSVAAQQLSSKVASKPNTPEEKKAVDVLFTSGSKQVLQSTGLANLARQDINTFLRPPDVGCAMSLLSFSEAKRAYGPLVADEYIAVQVIVRNLNRDQEFQLHDAEFAVDIDPGGRHSRFYSGRDKLIVRTFSVAQQSFDARNLTVHTAQAVGSLLNAIIPVYGGAFADAVGVLTGGAIPGLDKVWKDSTTDQLNLLNDTGFSSSVNSRTTVPKSGVVMFVTFVPAKTFENAWWTQDCANKTYLGSTDSATKILPAGRDSGTAGIDIDRALEPCLEKSTSTTDGLEKYLVNLATDPKPERAVDLFRGPTTLKYKKWSGNMVNTFRELSYMVVSGAHIIADSQLTPSVDQVNCPKDDLGNLKFDGGTTLSCPVVGSNLDKVQKLRLRNTSNQSDSVEGNLTVNGDSSHGTVSFVEKDLQALSGTTYSVFMVDKSDKETATTLALHFASDPLVAKIDPDSLDLSSKDPFTIKITGAHLKAIGSAILTSSDGKITDTFKVSDAADTSFSFELNKTSKVALVDASKQPVSFKLSLQPSASGSKPIETSLSLTLKNKLAATAGTNVPPTPVANKLDPNSLDLSSKNPFALKVTGTGLKSIGSAILTSKDGKIIDTFKVSKPTDTSFSFVLNKTSKVALVDASKQPIVFNLSLQPSSGDTKPIATSLTLIVSGKLTASGVAEPKAGGAQVKP